MSNLERYNGIFKSVFRVNDDALNGNMRAESMKQWDSIAHLTLVTEIEDAFDVMFDPSDILDLRSYEAGKTVLAKYGVHI